MKSKKTPKADLEKKRGLFLEIGLLLALGVCLAAFEWSSPNLNSENLGELKIDDYVEPEVVITKPEDPPEPPKKVEEDPKIVLEDINVRDNKEEVKKIDWSKIKKQDKPIIIIDDGGDDVPDEKTEPVPFHLVQDKPLYPGGDVEMFRFIQKNSVYPSIPKENGVEGKVFVQFVIDVNGKVTNPTIAKGVDPYLDAEAVRVVSLFPNWSPGKQRGIPVPVTFILPINFNLE